MWLNLLFVKILAANRRCNACIPQVKRNIPFCYVAYISGGKTSHRTNLMYVQQESLSKCGSFAVEIRKKYKKEVYTSRVQTLSYVPRKRENPTAHPEFETIQSDDTTIQRRRMFLHNFLKSSKGNLLLPSYSGFM